MATENIPIRTRSRAVFPMDPLQAIERLRWPWLLAPFGEMCDWAPTADVFVKGGKLVVEMDLPGTKKEDIDVYLEGCDLVVEGKREHDSEVDSADYHRMECSYGTFQRRITLPFDADVRAIQARFEHGVLHVEVPRPPAEKPQKVRVH
jgi:HSP20 family protein